MFQWLFKHYNWHQSKELLDQDPSTATLKIDLEKFNGKNDFIIWKIKMAALLITQGLGDVIQPITTKEGKEISSKTLGQAIEIDKKVNKTIILSFAYLMIRELVKETTVAGWQNWRAFT